MLRLNGNLSTGGTAEDVTDKVHPAIAIRAVEAAHVVGLDIAGVDVVVRDITRPLEEQGGGIVEVNAGPGLRMHLEPSLGQSRPVGDAIIESLYPAGQDGRIPIVAIAATEGSFEAAELVQQILKSNKRLVGRVGRQGISIDGKSIAVAEAGSRANTCSLLLNPRIDSLVLEIPASSIEKDGIGFEFCQASLFLHANADSRTDRVLIEAVSTNGAVILNADDRRVVALAEFCTAPVIYFTKEPSNPVAVRHRETGGRVVFINANQIVLATGGHEQNLEMKSACTPTVAAIATAWALDIAMGAMAAIAER